MSERGKEEGEVSGSYENLIQMDIDFCGV